MPLPLFPYQEQGSVFLADRTRAGLFDEPGVGKTAQAIRAIDMLRGRRGIIVAPAVARENWRGEFGKFAHIDRRICKGENIHDFVAWSRNRFDVLVTSYELATKWTPHVHDMAEPLDFVVYDEGHYLKNGGAKRVKALVEEWDENTGEVKPGLTLWAQSAWWLTGTPIPDNPIDIYTFLRFCRVMPLSRNDFARRYFSGHARTYSTAYSPRAEMLPELQRLISNNAVRRSLAQTGVELPPIFTTTALVDGDTQAIRDLLLQHPGLDRAITAALQGEEGGLSKINADHVATLRRLLGEAKAVPYAASLVHELNSGLDKMVTFGIHKKALADVRDYLLRHGINAVIINGDVLERDRVAAMNEFQNNPRCRVMLANIRAAGTALTMTASCNIDMLESDWTPGNNYQAIKRVHRITQTRNVRARFITLARSFDEVVNKVVAAKTQDIASVEGHSMTGAAA